MALLAGCGGDPAGPGPQATGTVDIKCLPAGLGAPWTLVRSDQLVAVGYGDSLLGGLPEGEQVFYWGRLPGWLSPEPDTLRVQVAGGQAIPVTGIYGLSHDHRAKVVVKPEPEGIAAPWFISGEGIPVYDGLGEGQVWLPAGRYTFSWGGVAGFVVPGGIILLELQEGATYNLQGLYRTENTPAGDVIIDAEPDSLLAGWTLTGPDKTVRSGRGDASLYGLPAGTYQLDWSPDDRWALPLPAGSHADLESYDTLVFQGHYRSYDPLPIEGLEVQLGPAEGEVDISWNSLDNVTIPIESYLMLATPVQEVAAPAWEEAIVLGSVVARGPGEVYREAVGLEAGLLPGVSYWFTVRGLDGQGRLTPVRDKVVLAMGGGHWVSGTLTDAQGRPLAGIPVQIDYTGLGEGPEVLVTATDGTFRGRALSSAAEVSVTTRSRDAVPGQWYDFSTGPLHDGQWEDLSLGLIPRRGVDPDCPQYGGSFLTYLRAMTNTDLPTNQRPDTRLNKWDHYPLSVYIPDYVNEHGFDMRALCATAPATWNTDMGEAYFTITDDSLAADVVFRFGLDNPQFNGEVFVLLPQGNHYIGDLIPEKMEVYIAADMSIAQRVREVALHELGHVLGCASHSLCYEAGYLMYVSSAGALDNGPLNAIHPDEKALIQCVRYLPQGVDMAGYIE